MLHVKEQIERHTMFLQHFQAAQYGLPDDEIVVRFILRDVADADELRVAAQVEDLFLAGRTRQIDPADDAGNERILLGELDPSIQIRWPVPGTIGLSSITIASAASGSPSPSRWRA